MSQSAAEGASRPSRRLLLSAIAAWVVIAVALPFAALALNIFSIASFPLGFWVTAQAALAALAVLAVIFAIRAGGTPSGEGWRPSLAFAGEALGAASVIGFTGAIAALGYDGLAMPLGLTAGIALMAIAIAPRFALYPVRSLGGFFVARFGGVWPRRVALIIAAVASALLLAADLRAGALALQAALGAEYVVAIAIIAVAVAATWFGRSFLGARPPSGIVYVGLLICLAIALYAYAVRHGATPIPYLAYGETMRSLAAIEQKLVVDKLSDVQALRPMSSPFLQLSMANFAGVVIALALGVSVLPHLLGRQTSQGAVAPGEASRRAAKATLVAAALLVGLAAFAVFARFGVAQWIAQGIEPAMAPPALADARALNWVEVCGAAADIASDCAKVSGHRGFLRMQDLAFSSDAFVVAAPALAGLPKQAFAPLWTALVLAAAGAGAALVSGVLDADGEARSRGRAPSHARDPRSVLVALALLIAAAALAAPGHAQIPDLLSDGLALVAAGLFPAIVLGLYWRRLNAAGAIAAMLTGFAVAAIYIAVTRLMPAQMFELTGHLSNAGPGAVRKFESLKTALAAAATEDARTAASLALHRHASTIANWGGLRPPAIVLVAAPLGALAGALFTQLSERGQVSGRSAI